jgi:hypothetical protein
MSAEACLAIIGDFFERTPSRASEHRSGLGGTLFLSMLSFLEVANGIAE